MSTIEVYENNLPQSVEAFTAKVLPKEWPPVFREFGICLKLDRGFVTDCPQCGETNSIKVQFRKKSLPWECVNCHCERVYFGNVVGLLRAFLSAEGRPLRPGEILGLLESTWLTRRAQGELPVYKLDFGKFSGRELKDVPKNYLSWLVRMQVSCVPLDVRNKIRSHLNMPPEQEDILIQF